MELTGADESHGAIRKRSPTAQLGRHRRQRSHLAAANFSQGLGLRFHLPTSIQPDNGAVGLKEASSPSPVNKGKQRKDR